MTGQLTSTFVWLGSDAVAHMAEEVQEAAVVVPQSMVLGYLVNGPLGLAMALTLVFSYGSIESAPKSTYPYVWLCHRAFENTSATTAFVVMVLFLLGAINVSVRAVSSRVTLASFAVRNRTYWRVLTYLSGFRVSLLPCGSKLMLIPKRRDNGLPFSHWLCHSNKTLQASVRAATVSGCLTIGLSLLSLGNTAAFTAALGLATSCLMSTYIISIGCILRKRICKEPLPCAQWSLGRAGLTINTLGLAYAAWAFFWSLWPGEYAVTASNFNWGEKSICNIREARSADDICCRVAPVLLVVLMGFACALFVDGLGSRYQGPGMMVQSWMNEW